LSRYPDIRVKATQKLPDLGNVKISGLIRYLCVRFILHPVRVIFSKVFASVIGSVKSEDGSTIAGAILIFSEHGTKDELPTDEKRALNKSKSPAGNADRRVFGRKL